jgi:hypothetical protein
MLKNSFYLCNNQFPWYAKVRENRSFRKRWLKLEYPSSQTLLLSIKIFQLLIYFALWEIPQDASQCEGNQSLQNKSTDKALKSNFQVESSTVKQKIFKTTHVRKRYIIEKSLNCRMKYSKYSFICSDKNTTTYFPLRDTIFNLNFKNFGNIYFTWMITSFLDILKLEKTVRSKALIETRIFEFTDPSSADQNFSSKWFLPHCERSRKMFLTAMGINPFKINPQIRRRNQIFKSKAARSNKKFSKRRTSGNDICKWNVVQ